MYSSHGPISCRRCFGSDTIRQKFGDFTMFNNPGYWGAENPLVLVLGFSKGKNQARAFERGEFDSVGFAGLRDRLGEILRAIGLDFPGRNVDEIMTAGEPDFGFASLIRCSVWLNGRTSGAVNVETFRDGAMADNAARCMEAFLKHLTPRLQLGVLLGNTPLYIKEVKKAFRGLHPMTFKDTGLVSFEAGGKPWLFAQHPSQSTGRHHRPYIDDEHHPKRDAARTVVRSSGVVELLNEGKSAMSKTPSTSANISAPVRRKKESSSRPSGNSLREIIRQRLSEHPDINLHPNCDSNNKKIFAYQIKGGATIAHEYNNQRQNIWVPERFVTEVLLRIDHRTSKAASLWQSDDSGKPRYGRHSGLKKYVELCNTDLVCISPETSEEVDLILSVIAPNQG